MFGELEQMPPINALVPVLEKYDANLKTKHKQIWIEIITYFTNTVLITSYNSGLLL